tara:strand:+ start:88705 stop:89979 length:1275 start_codon:yes stop_codon:yes gene_type:complete
MTHRPIIRPAHSTGRQWLHGMTTALLVGLTALTATTGPAAAQSFAPVIRVNDKVITQYEIDQRIRLLQLLNAPGDPRSLARDQLIEDRLKLGATEQFGVKPDETAITDGIAEFAGRANMEPDAFIAALASDGVSRQTFRDFITAGVAWRTLIRGRFGSKVEISEQDVDRAIASQGSVGGVRVLISEIFIPTGQNPAQAEALANQLSQIRSISEFSAAASKYSAASTRQNGGRVDWMNITSLPPALQSVLLGLSTGQVTQPLPVDGALALFQLRGMQETAAPKVTYSAIDYAIYHIDGGRTAEALGRAKAITDQIDTCDDLYGTAKGQPPQVLTRETRAPGEIPQDVAMELAKLDENEASTNLTANNGQTLELLMLCGRTPANAPATENGEVNRAQIVTQLQNRRLASYADGYLAQLRAEARIVE